MTKRFWIKQTLSPAPRFSSTTSRLQIPPLFRENCVVDVLVAFERRAFSRGQADRALTFLFGFCRHRARCSIFFGGLPQFRSVLLT